MFVSKSPPEHVVFIPGFMCDERLFKPQTDMLSLLGISFSFELMTEGSTIREFAIHALKCIPSRVALVGLSMGGIVALQIMRMAPERISHLALLNTTPHEDRSQSRRKTQIKRARNGELAEVIREELKPKYLSPASSKEAIVPMIADMADRLGTEVFVKQSIALMIRKSALRDLASINCPTTILTGEDDLVCTPQVHLEMAEVIKDSCVKLIPACGHLSTLESPEIVNQALCEHWGLNAPNVLKFPIRRSLANQAALKETS